MKYVVLFIICLFISFFIGKDHLRRSQSFSIEKKPGQGFEVPSPFCGVYSLKNDVRYTQLLGTFRAKKVRRFVVSVVGEPEIGVVLLQRITDPSDLRAMLQELAWFQIYPAASQGAGEVCPMVLADQKLLQFPAGNQITRRVCMAGRLERHVVGNIHRPELDISRLESVVRITRPGYFTAIKIESEGNSRACFTG